jgi:hypothetical protein
MVPEKTIFENLSVFGNCATPHTMGVRVLRFTIYVYLVPNISIPKNRNSSCHEVKYLPFWPHSDVQTPLKKSTCASFPVRIRVRIDPPHPLVCRKRRLNGAVLRMRPKNPMSRVTAGVAR